MRRDRRESKFHPDWEFNVIPLKQAWKIRFGTADEEAVRNARHKPNVDEMYVFTESYTLPVNDKFDMLILPGFCTDWASVPRSLRWMLPHDALCVRRAAVVHDALFNIGGGAIGFEESNKIFKRIILEDGGSKSYARLAYFGVASPIGKWHFKTEKEFDRQNRQFCILLEK